MKLADGRMVKVQQEQDEATLQQMRHQAEQTIARCRARQLGFDALLLELATVLAPYVEGMSSTELGDHFVLYPADAPRLNAAIIGVSLGNVS